MSKSFIDNLQSLAIVLALTFLIPLTAQYGAFLLSPMPPAPSALKVNGKHIYSANSVKDFIEKKSYKSDEELAILKAHLTVLEKYNKNIRKYYKTLFNVCVATGLIFLILGLVLGAKILNTGFILGGTFSIISGYTYYWRFLPNALQFFSLLVSLILVISLTYLKIVSKK